MQPSQPNNQPEPGVWVSREEYDRLRGQAVVVSAPMNEPNDTYLTKHVTIPQYLMLGSALLLLLSIIVNVTFLRAISGLLVLCFFVSAVISIVQSIRARKTLSKKQKAVNGIVLTLGIIIVAIPAFYIIGIILLFIMLGASGV